MSSTVTNPVAPQITLDAVTAADLMTGNPVSLQATASVPEATALLTDRGISAAPVIDDTGRPVGVVSKADILIHDRELYRASRSAEPDTTRVEDIMTPAVFSVTADTPAIKAIKEMVRLNVHQLFVVDEHGTLVGSISALDVLRHLHEEG
jgi:CBS-domain-containing membrane protein